MSFINTWDESDPADTKAAALGAADIRELMYAVRERLAVDHYHIAVEGSDTKIGYHKSGTFIDQTNDLLGVTGAVRIYGKTVSGKVEVFLVMADNTVVQITSNGKLNAAAIYGVIPIANLATGTPDGTKFVRDDGTLVVPDKSANAGEVVQVVNYQTGDYASGSNTIPDDDTSPLNTEGDEYMTLAITPKSATNKLKIDVVLNITNFSLVPFVVALFQDSTVGAIACSRAENAGAEMMNIKLTWFMDAGTINLTTFKVRAGGSSGVTYLNGNNISRVLGGKLISSMTITEVKV